MGKYSYRGGVRSPKSIIGRPAIRAYRTRSNPYRTTSPQRARQIALSKRLRPRFSTIYEKNVLGHPLITGLKEQMIRRIATHRKRRHDIQKTRRTKKRSKTKRSKTKRSNTY